MAPLFAAFSQQLLGLHTVARQHEVERFMVAALTEFRSLVPFASAWWGECSGQYESAPPINWQHGSIGLAPSLAEEWNDISGSDAFAQGSMRSLGRVCRASGHESDSPQAEQFSRRHDLFHAMAVTLELTDGDLMFFVSLYRGDQGAPFDDLEAMLFGEYCRHLMQQWQERIQAEMRRASVACSDGFALCTPSGSLAYIDAAIARAVQSKFPGWQGTQLPVAMVERLVRLPSTMRLGSDTLGFTACGGLVALSLGPASSGSGLPPRERAVAVLYAAGNSYKTIARQLGLSPATVRTYLRNAYLQLGVRNKVELGSLLGADGKHRAE